MVHHWGEELALTIHDSASARHMEVILVLVTVGIGLFFVVALIALEVVFRGHEVGQVWRSLRRAERALKKRLHEVSAGVRRDEETFAVMTRRYEETYISRHLRRRPIRDLRPYVSVSMSWSALERAGVSNLEQFLKFRGDFQRLRGIGDARARGLRVARAELKHEMETTSLPMPTIRRPGTLEFDVVSQMVRVVELRTQVRPRLEKMEEKLEEIRRERPGVFEVRRRFWLDDREQLCRQLASCRDSYEAVGADTLARLEQSAREAGVGTEEVEEIVEIYGEYQDVAKRVIDSASRRPVRGAVRPVGRPALQAAEGFDDEEDFCDRGLEPLVGKMGYRHHREFTIKRRIGSQERTLYVDFMLLDEQGRKVAVLEAKRSIRSDRQLDDARQQALSYALFKELRPMMVAAPEGLWLYERRGQETRFCAKYEMDEAYAKVGELRERIEMMRR